MSQIREAVMPAEWASTRTATGATTGQRSITVIFVCPRVATCNCFGRARACVRGRECDHVPSMTCATMMHEARQCACSCPVAALRGLTFMPRNTARRASSGLALGPEREPQTSDERSEKTEECLTTVRYSIYLCSCEPWYQLTSCIRLDSLTHRFISDAYNDSVEL